LWSWVAVIEPRCHPGVGHSASEESQLARHGLSKPEHDDVTDGDRPEPDRLQRLLRGGGIVDQEVRDSGAAGGELPPPSRLPPAAPRVSPKSASAPGRADSTTPMSCSRPVMPRAPLAVGPVKVARSTGRIDRCKTA
jgi:hypothetical protein